MKLKVVFGSYLGCAFMACSLWGQTPTGGTEYVQNGTFTQSGVVSSTGWTLDSAVTTDNSAGCVTGHFVKVNSITATTGSISQSIASLPAGMYDFSYYYKTYAGYPAGSLVGTLTSSIEGTQVEQTSISGAADISCTQVTKTIKNLSAGTSVPLSFEFGITTNPNYGVIYLSDISLKYAGSLPPTPPPTPSGTSAVESAAISSNGQTGNTNLNTAVNVVTIGSSITSGSSSSTSDTKSGITNHQQTTEANKAKGVGGCTITPVLNMPKTLSTIPMNTIFADAGILSSLESLDVQGVNLLHAQVKNEKEKSESSLKGIESMKRSLHQTLEEKAQNLNSISSKLGISFDLLDINALQDIEDLVASRFNDFILNKETNVQRLKREFRKDLAYFIHISKSLEKIEKNLSVVTNGITSFAEKYDLAIEKMNQKIKSTDASLSKNLRICLAGLKKTAISLTEVFEHYAKGQKIVSDLYDKVDVLAEKTKEILSKLYLLDMENAAASLEADLQAELAMIDVMDKESLVAAGSLTPSKQVTKGAESGSVSDGKNINVWGRALGQYMHQSKSRTSSAFSSGTGGALVGADWTVSDQKIGFAATYMYTYLGQAHNSGHTNVNQGGLAPYAVLKVSDWKFDTSLYGGYNYNSNHRNGNAGTVKYHAHSHSNTWQLAPHLQVTYTGLVKNLWWSAEPYVMGDYAASWQGSSTEKGAPGYNTKQKSSFSGFIRTEAGFTFNETIRIRYGQLILREKAGWAYQRALSSSTSTVSVIGTTGAFVAPNNAFIQNLAVAEFAMTFVSPKKYVPKIEVSYEGQFGSKFISQLGSVNLSKDF